MAANKKFCIFILIAATLALHSSAQTHDFTVGDYKGWNAGVNFREWSHNRDFIVGDTIAFKYPPGKYNVIEVDENGFAECIVPTNPQKIHTTGNDIIALDRPATRYFICGTENGKYCKNDNMKVSVLVPETLTSAGPTGPKEFIVGDDKGWGLGVDYQAWAQGKEFTIGDTLVFKYPVGTQNVYRIHETLYKDCIIPTPDKPFTTGEDRIILTDMGNHGFMSSVDNNCQKGVKLLIKINCPYMKKVQGGRKLVPQL